MGALMADHPQSVRRPNQLATWLILAASMVSDGCSGRDPVDPDPAGPLPPSPAVISNPVTPVAGSAASPAIRIPVVYVSLAMGTFPGGIQATIQNRHTGNTVTTVMIAGGLDPVALEAGVGDTLEFTITLVGRGPVRFVHTVPARKPPVIVRTDPPPARRDVPLNARIMVVFSEPVDPVTVSTSSIKLSRAGSAVPGQVTLASDGLSASFQPDAPLQDTTAYTLVVTTAVTDLDDDLLPAPFTLVFQTGSVPQPPLPLPSGVLLYTEGAGISLMAVDGSFYTSLTSGFPGYDAEGAWSPDGLRIAFTRYSGYDAEIHVMDADGTNLARISPVAGYDAHPTWSPDGTRIAFEHRPDSASGGNLYVMNADGTNRVQLTNLRQPVATPAWSPDGIRIAFTTVGDSGFDNLYLINTDGTNLVPLMDDSPGDWFPAWSPDGNRIAWVRSGPFGSDVFTINSDGTNLRRLTTTGLAGTPSWSRDGQSIVFVTYSECEYPEVCPDPRLWVAQASDGTLRELFPPGGRYALYPSWRP